MSRSRSRQDPLVVAQNYHDCWWSTTHNYYTDFETRYTPQFEGIVDEGGKKRFVGGRVAYKPVDHLKYTALFTGSGVWHWASPLCDCRYDLPARAAVVMDPLAPQWVDLAKWTVGETLKLLPSPLEYYAQHWDRCKPTVTTRANLFVFLYELRDIKRMFEILPAKHLLTKDGKRFKDWKAALSYANGQHLNYSFGWRPFLADIKNFRKALSSWRERLAKFISNQNQDLTRRASTPQPIAASKTFLSADRWWELKLEVSADCTFSSAFQFRYTVPDYGPDELVVRALADAFGLNLTLANIWAVIPFSFVVDWFIGVGKYLDRTTTTDWLEPDLVMLQACSARHAKGNASLSIRKSDTSVWYNTGSITFEHYLRTTESPSHTMIQLGDLNADKVRLLASLVGQRLL